MNVKAAQDLSQISEQDIVYLNTDIKLTDSFDTIEKFTGMIQKMLLLKI